MTLGDFITDVRGILHDPAGASAHWSDITILHGVCDAFRNLWAIRPDSRYTGSNMTLTDVVFPADASLAAFTISLDLRWKLGIVYFAAARCWEQDTTDTVTMQLADQYFKKANAVFAA